LDLSPGVETNCNLKLSKQIFWSFNFSRAKILPWKKVLGRQLVQERMLQFRLFVHQLENSISILTFTTARAAQYKKRQVFSLGLSDQ
jgi:hypothetical protein